LNDPGATKAAQDLMNSARTDEDGSPRGTGEIEKKRKAKKKENARVWKIMSKSKL